jgi:hypothetical protein
MKPCAACGKPVPQVYQGHRERIYCNRACQQQAYRNRHIVTFRLDLSTFIDELSEALIASQKLSLQWDEEEIAVVRKRASVHAEYAKMLENEIVALKTENTRLTTLLNGTKPNKKKSGP